MPNLIDFDIDLATSNDDYYKLNEEHKIQQEVRIYIHTYIHIYHIIQLFDHQFKIITIFL